MKHLYRIIAICGLLIITSTGYSKTSALSLRSGPPTFTINEGETIVLHGTSANAVAYQWYKDGVKISGAFNMDYTTGIAGIYTVVAFNIDGCASDPSNGIVVVVTPVVVKPDTAVDLAVSIQSTNTKAQPGDTYNYIVTANNNSQISGTQVKVTYVLPALINYVPQFDPADSVSYDPTTRTLTWIIGTLVTNKPMNLTVNVQVVQPGVIESQVDIKGKQPDPNLANNLAIVVQQVNPLIIPNVFTPNGDGVNDTFFIPGLDTYTETEITIINRWGNDVYEKKNYQNDWTGPGLPEGTYFYVLRVKTIAGVWDVYKGYVTLLRSKM
jgi:gliding motility-associated-like protein/uncharacterized repeat protein (TIGR01451 family)